jgi:hypothetical protein
MNIALQKTITLLLLIGLGIILRNRIKSTQALSGIKEIILSVALPSTIFIALMKISMEVSMLVIPLAMLLFNLILYYVIPLIFPFIGLEKKSPAGRTIMLLIPSLAPGLSCFPFIAEYLGEKSLALAALADVGNKFFVLIFLYVVALNMFLANGAKEKINFKSRLRTLAGSLVKEPVNLLILIALILLSFGLNYTTLPAVVTDLMDKTSALMIPLVLIFIGLAVQWKEARKKLVISVLFFRAGLTMLISAAIVMLLHISSPQYILLMVVLPLSSASFWPLAHISSFNEKENQQGLSAQQRTFDLELAVLILTFSLPFSTVLILGILAAGHTFTNPLLLAGTGIFLVLAAAVPHLKNYGLRLSRGIENSDH